jgi:hypothetical protein
METTHKANCHCGAVRYTVTLPQPFPEYKINQCNCSICEKNGYLLVYPIRRDLVFTQGMFSGKLASCIPRVSFCSPLFPGLFVVADGLYVGYDNLSEYYFGSNDKAHKFCKTCGSSILIDFKMIERGVTDDPEKDHLAVNVSPFHPFDFLHTAIDFDTRLACLQTSSLTRCPTSTLMERANCNRLIR